MTLPCVTTTDFDASTAHVNKDANNSVDMLVVFDSELCYFDQLYKYPYPNYRLGQMENITVSFCTVNGTCNRHAFCNSQVYTNT